MFTSYYPYLPVAISDGQGRFTISYHEIEQFRDEEYMSLSQEATPQVDDDARLRHWP